MKIKNVVQIATVLIVLFTLQLNAQNKKVLKEGNSKIIKGADQKIPRLGKNTIKEVIAAMTVDEKIKMVNGTGMNFPGMPDDMQPIFGNNSDKVPGAAGYTFGIARLGIPSIVLSDGPAGLRITPKRTNDGDKTYYCTAFPIGTLLASTWDKSIVQKVGTAMGEEVKNYGVDVLLAPAINIHRNPLGGRNFEYFSEDPVIAGNIAAAYINGIQSNGVGTSIKHFALNNHEFNRNVINVKANVRSIREIYLKGFEIAIKESNPWTVMSSYNRVNGKYTSESHDLLTTILKEEWHYKGLVMSDWFGGSDAVAQMIAGNDLLEPGTAKQQKQLLEGITNKTISADVLDRNIERVLKVVMKSQAFKNYKYSNITDLKAHAIVSRTAATEGMVLLKNQNNALPLAKTIKKIAVLGNASYEMVTGGTGSGDVYEAYNVSLTEGLTNAGYSTDAEVKSIYEKYITAEKSKIVLQNAFFLPDPIAEMDWSNANPAMIEKLANESDVAIVTIGRNSGEFKDRNIDNDFNLNPTEIALIKNVSEVFHAKNKRTIVVLNIGGVVETKSWSHIPDAILLSWLPGQEAGNAITDILSGSVNPSGKLATTFPINYSDVPSSVGFPGKVLIPRDPNDKNPFGQAKAAEIEYHEGIDIGYRYFDKNISKIAYEFGFGLSYSEFSFSNLKISTIKKDKISVTVDITNIGKTAGKEVVQIYVAAPKSNLIDKPVKELKAFAKTKTLQPSEKQTVTVDFDYNSIASFYTDSSSWIIEAGNYEIQVGNSSQKISQKSTFNVAKNTITEKVHPVDLGN